MKKSKSQRLAPREPRQDRSRYKVQLILEATVRLLEKGEVKTLTTNAIAASAGVSIGTLYQFFSSKETILDALAERELVQMSARLVAVMEDPDISSPEERVAAVVRTVAESYGGRSRAHRLVMVHSLAGSSSNRLSPLLDKLIAHLSHERQVGAIRQAIRAVDAFVLAHAFTGVLRATVGDPESAPPRDEVARALARLVLGFIR